MQKIITLNCEGDRHLGRVIPFLERESPDIFCAQEIYEESVPQFLGSEYQHFHLPNCLHDSRRLHAKKRPWGTAIYTRLPVLSVRDVYLYTPSEVLLPFDESTVETRRASMRQGMQILTLDDAKKTTIINTHFTWIPHGDRPTEYQRTDMDTLLSLLHEMPDFIMCGDFNIPRDTNELYKKLAGTYTDHVPLSYTSSMDMTLHRLKDSTDVEARNRVAHYMVDYIWTRPHTYDIRNVHLQCGVSDHCAVIAEIH